MGPAGPEGPKGDTGSQGVPGVAGLQGTIGPEGLQGQPGAQGLTGATGAQGPTGTTGPQGPVGPEGVVGPQGPQGPVGPMGPQGDTGAQGIQGAQGTAGPTGGRGPAGADGASAGYTANYDYIGCYSSILGKYGFDTYVYSEPLTSSVDDCAKTCSNIQSSGYPTYYFSLGTSPTGVSQCTCGNALGLLSGTTDRTLCTTPCNLTSSSRQYCGSSSGLLVSMFTAI
jgi:syndecan 1